MVHVPRKEITDTREASKGKYPICEHEKGDHRNTIPWKEDGGDYFYIFLI